MVVRGAVVCLLLVCTALGEKYAFEWATAMVDANTVTVDDDGGYRAGSGMDLFMTTANMWAGG